MTPLRWIIAIVLTLLAIGSTWLLNRVTETGSTDISVLRHDPDNYMHDLTTLTMNHDGSPKNKLYADYMAHYPDDNTTELLNPKLEIFRIDKPPTIITAEKGWVTEDNEVILLSGNTRLLQLDNEGNRELEIITTNVRVLLDQEYAETDDPATIFGKKSTIKSTGMNAYLGENRLELLDNVYTKILP
ncbi:MAG: lipopolysaccharide export system protein LptC [Gammaproteobacteria bacterium]|jgi:lipopolysaccharide export system protein LptC